MRFFKDSQRYHLRAVVNKDGAVILNRSSGIVSTLNSTGAIVWQALERGEHIATVVEQIARETGAEIEIVRKDVADFIDSLRKQDLLPG